MHTSTEIWGNPDVFRPERFLTDEGRFMSNHNEMSLRTGQLETATQTKTLIKCSVVLLSNRFLNRLLLPDHYVVNLK